MDDSPPNQAALEALILQICTENQSAYDVLGVTIVDATDDLVKQRYNRLILLLHPDRCSHPKSAEAFGIVREAYKLIKSFDARAVYVCPSHSRHHSESSHFPHHSKPFFAHSHAYSHPHQQPFDSHAEHMARAQAMHAEHMARAAAHFSFVQGQHQHQFPFFNHQTNFGGHQSQSFSNSYADPFQSFSHSFSGSPSNNHSENNFNRGSFNHSNTWNHPTHQTSVQTQSSGQAQAQAQASHNSPAGVSTQSSSSSVTRNGVTTTTTKNRMIYPDGRVVETVNVTVS